MLWRDKFQIADTKKSAASTGDIAVGGSDASDTATTGVVDTATAAFYSYEI